MDVIFFTGSDPNLPSHPLPERPFSPPRTASNTVALPRGLGVPEEGYLFNGGVDWACIIIIIKLSQKPWSPTGAAKQAPPTMMHFDTEASARLYVSVQLLSVYQYYSLTFFPY